MLPVQIKRIYEAPCSDNGYCVLVDRIWPRGVKKEDAQIDEWLKDVAPSHILRKWFGHQPEKWEPFYKRYAAELHASAVLHNLKT